MIDVSPRRTGGYTTGTTNRTWDVLNIKIDHSTQKSKEITFPVGRLKNNKNSVHPTFKKYIIYITLKYMFQVQLSIQQVHVVILAQSM